MKKMVGFGFVEDKPKKKLSRKRSVTKSEEKPIKYNDEEDKLPNDPISLQIIEAIRSQKNRLYLDKAIVREFKETFDMLKQGCITVFGEETQEGILEILKFIREKQKSYPYLNIVQAVVFDDIKEMIKEKGK